MGNRFRHLYLTFLVLVVSASLSSCLVGPDFHSPSAPRAVRYTHQPLGKKTVATPAAGKAGQSQHFTADMTIPGEWWQLYRSHQLNTLIDTGLANSPNLAAAQAVLRQAKEALLVQIGNSFFPAFNAGLSGERQRFPGSSFGNTLPNSLFNLFNANANVSYMLDVFGGQRRLVESFQAQVDYQHYQLIGAYLALTANIATTAVTIAALQDQIKATHSLIRAEQEQLVIIKKQFRLGGVSEENILSQETLVQQTLASLPPLEQRLSQSRHALSVLIGDYPDGSLPSIRLESLTLPTKLPVSLPSRLVCQRPDVQAAEALLHAASAQIGVATANLLPQINLTGAYGFSGSVPSTLFKNVNETWNIGAALTQPIFHGGALFAQRREAIATYDQALAAYEQTVLQAFQNVADSLRAIENDAKRLRALKTAEISARKNFDLSRKQYRLGGVSYLQLLTAEEQYQQTVINRIQSQAARYNDTTALFQALGGGWWHVPERLCQVGHNVSRYPCDNRRHVSS